MNLNKQQALDADQVKTWKAIQQNGFTVNLDWDGNENTTIFAIIEKAIKNILDFPHGTVRVLQIYFALI